MSRLSVRSPKCHRNLQPRSATRKWLHVALPEFGRLGSCGALYRDGNGGCNTEHSAAAVVRVKRMGNSSGWVTTGTLKLPPQGWCWLGGYSTQYRPHSYNHTLTMGLVWAGSELRTLAPWPPHCISTMRSMVQWPQYRLIVNKTCKYSASASHHCMGLICN